MPAVHPRLQPGMHWTSCAPSAAVPPTHLDALKALAVAKADPQPQAPRTVMDQHRNVLGDCAVCRTTWPCDTGFAS